MADDFVHDNEILYRRIATSRNLLYEIRADGTIKISSAAFASRDFRIFVDRAKLCNNDPRYTLGDEPGVVVSLIAEEVRNIDEITRNDRKGNPVQQFRVDVEPVPLLGNPAHAEIYAIPEFIEADANGAFHRLCRRLARLAQQG
jgi:hypothetical protein